MKPTSNLLKWIVVGVVVLLALNAWYPRTRATASTPYQESAETSCNTGRSVQVSGAAVIYITPDRVRLQLGVQTNGTTPEQVQTANFTTIQRVIGVVRALGVEAKDIATDYVIVYPVYSDYDSLVIKGYRVDNTLSVTLRDINLVDDVVVAALKAGANEIQDLQFYTSELRKYRDQARELAMKAAGEKAQALASAAGAQADCVLSITENTWSQYYGSWWGGRQMYLWAQNAVQNASSSQEGSSQDDSPISLGQIAVRAEVNASYSLR
jgi:uncharacterized protein YggE